MEGTNNKAKYILAMLLIAIGVSSILNQIFGWNLFRFIDLGGMFVLIPGLWFEYLYFSKHHSPGVLVPGGILTTIGVLTLIESNTFPMIGNYIDSLYIMAPAVGLFQLYVHDKRDKGLLIPVVILTLIALMDFISEIVGDIFSFIDASIVWPIILVIIGVSLLRGRSQETKEKERL
ncbi:MAG: hypothetical protein J6F30_06335 [Cellulosilyticum sp.]|nr:hypothetical protein [Cellulosilyticum sp.]